MEIHDYEGRFIVFEGPDGTGKTTQVGLLTDLLESRSGTRTVSTEEPTEYTSGKAVYEAIEKDMSPETVALQFAADRLQHLERKIEPALKAGKTVVSDRYAYSSLAYQPALSHEGREVSRPRVELLNKSVIRPDLALILDVYPQNAMERISDREGEDLEHEKLKLQRKVRENYLEMSDREEVEIVDGSGKPEDVHERVVDLVESRF